MMMKIKKLILLAVSLAVMFAGCGDSTGGYGVYRSSDMVTVFVPLPDTSEIAEAKVGNKALHLDIDTGEKIVPREIKLQSRFFQGVNPDETVEIHGRNRINDYAVIHLRAFHTQYRVSKNIKLFAYKFYDSFKLANSDKKPEPFDNSGAFRFGDRMMAYCRLQDYIDSPPKEFEINVSIFKNAHTNTVEYYKETITDEKSGHPILIIDKHGIDADKTDRNLHFLLKDLEPHETVGIEKVRNLGDKIVIAELRVVPRESQPPNGMIFRDR